MFRVYKEIEFSSAHAIRGHKQGCEKLHGHNYRVRVWVEREDLDELGMVVDFKTLKEILKAVALKLDHQNLNTIPPFTEINATAENLAYYFFKEVQKSLQGLPVSVVKVELFETPTSCAIYEVS